MEKLLLETNPPKFSLRRIADREANSIVDAASNFHNSFGLLPSLRCRGLAACLEEYGAGKCLPEQLRELPKRFGLNERTVKKLGAPSALNAANVLRQYIAPVYERHEKGFTDLIRTGLKRLGKEKDYPVFIGTSAGTPFIKLTLDEDAQIFRIMPTCGVILKRFGEKLSSMDYKHYGLAALRFERTGYNELLVRNLQAPKFKTRSLMGEYKHPFAPYCMLEQLFLLVAGTAGPGRIFIPTAKAVLEYWRARDLLQGTAYASNLKLDLQKTELRAYDEIGSKYGEAVEKLPPETEFARTLNSRVPGYCMNLA